MEMKKVWRRITIFLIIFLGLSFGFVWMMLKDDIMLFIRTILLILGSAAVPLLVIGITLIKSGKHAKIYTEHTTGTFTGVKKFPMSDNVIGFYFDYVVNDEAHSIATYETDCVSENTPIGTEVTIWYDPEDPLKIIATDDIKHYGNNSFAWKLTIGSAILFILGIISFITL